VKTFTLTLDFENGSDEAREVLVEAVARLHRILKARHRATLRDSTGSIVLLYPPKPR